MTFILIYDTISVPNERQVQDMNVNDIVERYPIDVMEHAERIMNLVRPFGKEYMMIALLHDILEDTDVKISDLYECCFTDSFNINSHIIDKIIILTRMPNETYFEYIKLIIERGGKECIIIKYYDILDHLNNKETLKPSLKKRYLKAKEILEKYI